MRFWKEVNSGIETRIDNERSNPVASPVSAKNMAMKYLTFFLALLASNSILALPNFDPFADATANGGTSYAVDSPLAPQNDNAGNNWQLVGSVNPANPQPMIVAGNLSYANLP